MYGVSNENELIQSPVNGGKHENTRITEIAVEKVGKDQDIPTLTFKFAFEGGSTMTHRAFPVNQESIARNISKFRGKTVQEVMETEMKRTAAGIIHIMGAFVPKEKLLFVASSWEEYIGKMVEIAGTAYESETFRCKTVYDKKGYVGFPKTAFSPWFQNMKDADTITINPKYDVVVPPAPTQEANLDAGDMEMTSTVTAGDEDLAF